MKIGNKLISMEAIKLFLIHYKDIGCLILIHYKDIGCLILIHYKVI